MGGRGKEELSGGVDAERGSVGLKQLEIFVICVEREDGEEEEEGEERREKEKERK